jgi:hypothetical protein
MEVKMRRILLIIAVITLGLITLINAYEFLKGTSKNKHQIIFKSRIAIYVYIILLCGIISIVSSIMAYILEPDLLLKTSVMSGIGLVLILNALMGIETRTIVTNEGIGYMTISGRIIRFVQWENIREWKWYKKSSVDFKVKIKKDITHINLKVSDNEKDKIEEFLKMHI